MTYPHGQQPAPWAPPARAPRRRHQGLLAAVGVTLAVVMLGVLVAVVYAVTRTDSVAPAPDKPAAVTSSERPTVNLGEGTPGAACSTDRLGKTFEQGGVTYTCKGPKPYHWQP